MEISVGCWVIVTARVMNQNANNVTTEIIGRTTAALNDNAVGSVTSLFGMNTVDTRDNITEKTPDMMTR